LALVLEMERGWQPDDLPAVRNAVVDAISREHQLQVARLMLVKANSIPKTSSGKVQRRRTRERCLAGELNELCMEVCA
jgi:acyl-CoA synthetase (AMP-forming)/AMP-acid ligase II